MNLHFLGIGGTFMGSLAYLAQCLGHKVSGQDENIYPPMSIQLAQNNISYTEGYNSENIPLNSDLIIVGNAISRGNSALEYVLNQRLNYISAPQFLSEYILRKYHVLAVAGTHGKTTTASMLAFILDFCGLNPSFLIGGAPQNFSTSSRLTNSPYFVLEADEYDSAFCDKRSKFIHYRPQTLVLNNLEFDHGDIFANLDAIESQFKHLLRTIASNSTVIYNASCASLQRVISSGAPMQILKIQTFANDDKSQWIAENLTADCSQFKILFDGQCAAFDATNKRQDFGTLKWNLIGHHNMHNAVAAIAAASDIGIVPKKAIKALAQFKGVTRRLEQIAKIRNIKIFDDFAHHPTAITTTLDALRNKVKNEQIIAIIELRSNTMKTGIHNAQLTTAVANADVVIWHGQSAKNIQLNDNHYVCANIEQIMQLVKKVVTTNANIVIMSNGAFDNIYQKLPAYLR